MCLGKVRLACYWKSHSFSFFMTFFLFNCFFKLLIWKSTEIHNPITF